MMRLSLQNEALRELLALGFAMNVGLAIFNLLPIPPLDGSRIADWLMPRGLRPQWEQFASLGPILLLVVIMVPPFRSIVSWPIERALQLGIGVLHSIVGA
jgi:Zn-dependent protease